MHVLNAAARLIARFPKFSHISPFMFNQLHWLPLSARIEFKIAALVLKSKLGVAPKYHRGHIRFPLSATSHRPLRSLDRFFVPRVKTTMAQTRSLATIGSSLWSVCPSSLHLCCLDLLQHPSPFTTPISTFEVFALGAPLSGLYRERRFISKCVTIRYDMEVM